MDTIPFKKIRAQHPDKFLILVDYDENYISPSQFEVLGAKIYHVYDTGKDMFNAYRYLRKKGLKVMICTPDYQDRFVVERKFTARIFG